MATIKDIMGDKFSKTYNQSKRFVYLPCSAQIKQEIIDLVKSEIRPDSASLQYPFQNKLYDILLVESQDDLRMRNLEFGTSISFKWRGEFAGVIFRTEEEALKIQPNSAYIIAGKFTISEAKNGSGKKYNNMRADLVIPLEELYQVSAEKNVVE